MTLRFRAGQASDARTGGTPGPALIQAIETSGRVGTAIQTLVQVWSKRH
jgi:hypothetical protein